MNSRILIGGCSWACGEWSDPKTRPTAPDIAHLGLEQYLREDGFDVVNLARPAASNSMVADKINTWIWQNSQAQVSAVIIFQTEYTRETDSMPWNAFGTGIKANDLQNQWCGIFYQRLSDIAQQLKCPVILIGGCSDTHDQTFVQRYPGLIVGCQSLVNLIITGDADIVDPVMSWYGHIAEDFVVRLKSCLSIEQTSKFLDMIDQGHQRMNLVLSNKQYFWPDGAHPNRHAHKILYQYLRDQQLI